MLQSNIEPNNKIGIHCFKPYNRGFFKYCTKGLKSPNVFDLYRLSTEKARESLLEYCGLDTYAMVKILEKLHEVTK